MKPPSTARNRFRRTLLRCAILVAGTYLIVAGMFVTLQRTLIYPAMRSEPLAAAEFGIAGVEMEDVSIRTSDGLTLHGWHARPADGEPGRRPVILFLHGNGGNRVHRLDDLDLLTGLGAEVILFDYRGYAENPGAPSEEGFATDANAMWDFVTTELGVPADRVVLFGESLGGGVAVRLAAEKCDAGTPPAGLILRSTFSSMTDAASWHYPWLPVRLALRDRYESRERIRKVTSPLLCLHGDADGIVPIRLGRKLFDAAPQASATGIGRRFVVLPGAGHNDVIDVARGAYRAAVETFLREVIPPIAQH